jgi:hypothetical protein
MTVNIVDEGGDSDVMIDILGLAGSGLAGLGAVGFGMVWRG